ncbi:MAG: hypothetical protein WCO59_02080 [Actinomycetes bacterium]
MSSPAQLRPLIALRWKMVREPSTRRGLAVALFIPVALLLITIVSARLYPASADSTTLLVIVPALLLGFLVLSIFGPLAAGGGNELYPADQLVAFPIKSRTTALAALCLTPLNLAWLVQVLIAFGLMSYLARSSWPTALAAATTIAVFIAGATVFGQWVGWLIVGIRQRIIGRIVTWIVALALGMGFLALLRSGSLTGFLDKSPTLWVVVAALGPSQGNYARWFERTALLGVFTAGFFALSLLSCRWALRQPHQAWARTSSSVRAHRPTPHAMDPRKIAVRMDRKGLWRSPSISRGLVLLALIPAVALWLAGSQLSLMALLPGLIAAGSALLFGVNAFCLDGPGAVWLAGLPMNPSVWFWRRTRLVAGVALAATAPIVVIGLVRLPDGRQWSTTAIVVLSALSSIAWITASSMRTSLTRPHRALLLNSRDTPAPPGSMAVYSIKLSAIATGIGIIFTIVVISGSVMSALIVTTGLIASAILSLLRSRRTWERADQRALVVTTVSAGQ